jgi:hypothetical protein
LGLVAPSPSRAGFTSGRATGKLRPRFYGPFHVSAVINSVAYHLDLPPRARTHDVFHVALLKKFVGEPPATPPVLSPFHHDAVVPEPECVIKARLARSVHQVLVRWKDESPSSATWEDLDNFIERYPEFQLED